MNIKGGPARRIVCIFHGMGTLTDNELRHAAAKVILDKRIGPDAWGVIVNLCISALLATDTAQRNDCAAQ